MLRLLIYLLEIKLLRVVANLFPQDPRWNDKMSIQLLTEIQIHLEEVAIGLVISEVEL